MADAQPPDWNSEQYAPMRLLLQVRHNCTEEEAIAMLQRTLDGENNHRNPSPPRSISQQPSNQRSPSPDNRGNPDRPVTVNKEPTTVDFDLESKISDRLPQMAARFAIERVQNIDWVQMHYFTSEGTQEAANDPSILLDNSLQLVETENGFMLQHTKSAKPAKHVIEDEDLTWSQLLSARHNIIKATNGWPDKLKMAHAYFFVRLEELKAAGVDEKALVLYQAATRKRWHAALKGEGDPFNISNINFTLLADFQNQVRDKKIKALTKEVEVLSQSRSREASNVERDRGRTRGREKEFYRPRSSRSRSPRRKPSTKFRRNSPSNEAPLPACPICLSRQRHPIKNCRLPRTWDGKHKTSCYRSNDHRIIDGTGRSLCINWNQVVGCKDKSSKHIHECSGCGDSSHGAQECRLAEKAHAHHPADRD